MLMAYHTRMHGREVTWFHPDLYRPSVRTRNAGRFISMRLEPVARPAGSRSKTVASATTASER